MVDRKKKFGVAGTGVQWPGFGSMLLRRTDLECGSTLGEDALPDHRRQFAIELEFRLAACADGAGRLQRMTDIDRDHRSRTCLRVGASAKAVAIHDRKEMRVFAMLLSFYEQFRDVHKPCADMLGSYP